MSARDESAELAAVVAREGALPMPVAPEPQAPMPVAFLASRDSQVLGLYTLSEDALHHCEDALGRTAGYGSFPFSWRERPDGSRELFVWTYREVESATGFTVVRLELRDEFDEGWGADADVVPDPVAVSSERPVDAVTRAFAPTQALYEERAAAESDSGRRAAWRMLAADVTDGEHYGAVHHSYRVSHDLPETSGDDRG